MVIGGAVFLSLMKNAIPKPIAAAIADTIKVLVKVPTVDLINIPVNADNPYA